MFEINDNYFVAQDLLVEHLACVDGIARAYTLRELKEIKENAQVTPSLHVAYYEDKLPETASGGSYMNITQTWIVVLAVKVIQEGEGEILTKVIKALAGKNVGGIVFQRVKSPVKPYFGKGFNYYPLAFSCQLRMKTT